MKRLLLIIISGLIILSPFAQAQEPKMNGEIVKYVKSVLGKKVGRGECWDLAHDALTLVNAQWDHQFKFGKEVDPAKDSIYPGDIIHFDKVMLKFKQGNEIVTENYPQHTAIVYEVTGKGEYKIAHQNNSYSGRKVGISTLRLADRKSGKWQFYRPQPN